MSNVTVEQPGASNAQATAWTRTTSEYLALLRAGAAQQPGAAARRENALAVYLPNNEAHASLGSIFVLAEGVGKLPGSAIAGKLAVEQIVRTYYASTLKQPGNRLQSAVARAGQEIFDAAQRQPQLRGMGAAFVGAVVAGDKLWLASSGNSRAYLLRPATGTVEMLTQTQLLGEPSMTRPLGAERQSTAHHVGPISMAAGDVLLLCSESLAADVEGGAPLRYLQDAGRTRAGADPQALADLLAGKPGQPADSGAAIAATAQAVVPWAAALRAGWPKRYARQLTLPLSRPALVDPAAPTREVPVPALSPRAQRELPAASASPGPENGVPDWLSRRPREQPGAVPDTEERPARPASSPLPPSQVPTTSVPRPAPIAAPKAAPVVSAASATAATRAATAAALAATRGAPQWLSHLVIVTAIGILSTMAGVVIGLGADHWLTAAGVGLAVLVIAALLLALLQYSRRPRPAAAQAEAQSPAYRIPRRIADSGPAVAVPTSRKPSRALAVSSSKMEYRPAGGKDRTPPIKVDIRDDNGTIVGRLALGAPEHLIEPESGKPIGFYVLLYDAISGEERAMAWLAQGPQQSASRPGNQLVLRDVAVPGEDPHLRVSWLRGGSVFTIKSSTLAAEMELLFYHYGDPVRKSTLDSVQVGIRNVTRLGDGTEP